MVPIGKARTRYRKRGGPKQKKDVGNHEIPKKRKHAEMEEDGDDEVVFLGGTMRPIPSWQKRRLAGTAEADRAVAMVCFTIPS